MFQLGAIRNQRATLVCFSPHSDRGSLHTAHALLRQEMGGTSECSTHCLEQVLAPAGGRSGIVQPSDAHASALVRSPYARFPLSGSGHVHHAAIFVEGDVKSFLSLNAVQRQVKIAAGDRQKLELFRRLGVAEPAPGTVAEIQNAIRVRQASDERLGPLEWVIVMFKDDRHPVLLEQRHGGRATWSDSAAGPERSGPLYPRPSSRSTAQHPRA